MFSSALRRELQAVYDETESTAGLAQGFEVGAKVLRTRWIQADTGKVSGPREREKRFRATILR